MDIHIQYKPFYHASVPKGWGNDPNGMIWFRNRGHLFFQHFPDEPQWGTMHWGHFKTADFVRWEELPIALWPDQDYEQPYGCWSGTSIEKDGKLVLMYTASRTDRQSQCLAVSEDGVHFEKCSDNPILIAEDLSPEVSVLDFRDPKIFKKDGMYYCLAGTMIDGYGNLILFKSEDLAKWSYCGRLFRQQEGMDPDYFRLEGVYECPDIIESNGQTIILSSPQKMPQKKYMYANINSTVWMAGDLDYETGRFQIRNVRQIDDGFDFYAPQCMRLPDGRTIMIAWKEMWGRSFPTEEYGWVGTYTLPRELVFRDGHLYQYPVRELAAYRKNEVIAVGETIDGEIACPGIEGNVIELDVTLNPLYTEKCGVKFFVGGGRETVLTYEPEAGTLTFDRSRSGIVPTGKEDTAVRVIEIGPMKSLRLQIFLDVSCAEVFVNWGQYVMTGNVFPEAGDTGVRFFAEGGKARLVSAVKYDIVV